MILDLDSDLNKQRGSPNARTKIQIKLYEHKLIREMYDKSPDYLQLAKDLTHKKEKSKIGLLDDYDSVLHAAKNFKQHCKNTEKREKRNK